MKALVAVSKSREWVESEWEEQLGTHKIPSGWQVRSGKLRQFTAAERHNTAALEALYNYDDVVKGFILQVKLVDHAKRVFK